jgi:hypothetical protein
VQRIGCIIHVAKVRKSLESTVPKRLGTQNLLREIVVFYTHTVVFSHYCTGNGVPFGALALPVLLWIVSFSFFLLVFPCIGHIIEPNVNGLTTTTLPQFHCYLILVGW